MPIDNDRFVTREDLLNLWRGLRNALLIAAPIWAVFIYWFTR